MPRIGEYSLSVQKGRPSVSSPSLGRAKQIHEIRNLRQKLREIDGFTQRKAKEREMQIKRILKEKNSQSMRGIQELFQSQNSSSLNKLHK